MVWWTRQKKFFKLAHPRTPALTVPAYGEYMKHYKNSDHADYHGTRDVYHKVFRHLAALENREHQLHNVRR